MVVVPLLIILFITVFPLPSINLSTDRLSVIILKTLWAGLG